LERLRHMNIIDYKHSWLEIDRHSELCPYVPFLYILMEYCNAGSLEASIWPRSPGFVRGSFDNVRRAQVLHEEMIWSLFEGVCGGLHHLHSRGILHMDLKPSNIMLHVEDSGEGSSTPRPLLSDFGTCEILGEGPSLGTHGGYAVEFSAPERLENEEVGEPGDMWSAGLVLYAMCYGDLPYHSENPEDCRRQVLAHRVLADEASWRSSRPRAFWDLVCILTSRQPVARLTARQCETIARREQERLAMEKHTAPPQQLKSIGSPAVQPQMLMDGDASAVSRPFLPPPIEDI